MNCELIKLTQFSGNKASIYTVYLLDDEQNLFERFVEENKISLINEINNIFVRLKTIGHKTGARENFFKHNEGIPGDGVCALYDEPNKKLRLYCIRYGTDLIILGGGGEKPKNVRALQEVDKLKDENDILRKISSLISKRLKDKEISFTNNYRDLEGNLIFNENE
jgi:hypothetical protein